MTSHLYAYAKAYYAALAAGFLYLATVIGPDITVADLAHVSLLHWIGFVGSVLGVGAGTAAITNGPTLPKQDATDVLAQVRADATRAPTTFPKAAVDAAVAVEADLPLAPVPVVPEVPAPAAPNTIA